MCNPRSRLRWLLVGTSLDGGQLCAPFQVAGEASSGDRPLVGVECQVAGKEKLNELCVVAVAVIFVDVLHLVCGFWGVDNSITP